MFELQMNCANRALVLHCIDRVKQRKYNFSRQFMMEYLLKLFPPLKPFLHYIKNF